MTRSITIVHNNVDNASSIGAIAAWDVREALRRGWEVTVVCADLDPELVGSVRHRRLYVPPRVHMLQWSVARPTVRAALRGVCTDVVVVHQPQLAAIANVWNVHYLSRAAREVRARRAGGWRPLLHDVEAAGVAALEDRYLSRVPASTRVLFCGDGLSDEFARLYGEHPNSRVLANPALRADQHAAPNPVRRREITGGHAGPVVGFLGGGDPRKGGDLLAAAVAVDPSLFLVHAGSTPLDVSDPRLCGREFGLGGLADVGELFAVVDVLVVPSRFDPFPLVVAEAAAAGIPVLVSHAVGSAQLVASTGAGAVWDPCEPLGPVVGALSADPVRVRTGAERLLGRLDPDRLADERFDEFDRARRAVEDG